MKEHLTNFSVWTTPFRAILAVSALCAFIPISRAALLIDNTGQTTDHYDSPAGYGGALGEAFETGGSPLDLNSVGLLLDPDASGSATVNLVLWDNVNGQDLGLLSSGTISPTSGGLTYESGINYNLAPNTYYAIELEPASSGAMTWAVTSSSDPGTGATATLGATDFVQFSGNSVGPIGDGYLQMDLSGDPVPEVPITGLVTGFGALASAIGATIRRKLRSTAHSTV